MDQEVVWTDQAWLDLENIADYIARDSEYYASQVVKEIREATSLLPQFPRKGRPVPEVDDSSIRELLVANHRLIYRVDENKIFILTIVHTARDLNQLWEDD